MAVLSDITTGTISVANGSPTVTGVGTAWQIQGFKEGDFFIAIGAQLVAVVQSVNSNTSITLTKPWEGVTLSGAPYRLRYQADGERVTAKAQQLIDSLTGGFLSDLVDLVPTPNTVVGIDGSNNTVLIPITDLVEGIQTDAKVETLPDRAAYDGQPAGYSVLVADVGDGRSAIYFKLSGTPGDWSDPAFLTGPSGTVVQTGPYNPATAYVVGNIVLQNGSSWVARVNTTGNAPPTLPTTSNTQWFLLAAAGNGFLFRGDYSGATAYVKDDVVFNQNSSWIALVSTTGNAPPTLPATSNTQWKAIAVRGAGDFSGPASSVTGNIVVFGDGTGKNGVDSGVPARTALTDGMITNGSFQISQERGTALSTTGQFFADQWTSYAAGAGVFTGQLVSLMTPKKNTYRARFIVTTPDASIAAGDLYEIYTPVEGQDMARLGYGAAGALPSVLRFGFKGPAGTYTASIVGSPANRSRPSIFTVSAPQANTEIEVVIPIPGDTAGTWPRDSSFAALLTITLAAGSTYTGAPNVWSTGNFPAGTGQSNMMATNGNTFEIFDVDWYPDPFGTGIPPTYRAPTWSQELKKCKRYWEEIGMTVSTVGGDLTNTSWWMAEKRTVPTIAQRTGSVTGATIAVMSQTPLLAIRQISNGSLNADTSWTGSAR